MLFAGPTKVCDGGRGRGMALFVFQLDKVVIVDGMCWSKDEIPNPQAATAAPLR